MTPDLERQEMIAYARGRVSSWRHNSPDKRPKEIRAMDALLATIERQAEALRLDLTVSEKLKLDIGAAIREERIPVTGPDFENGFNQGLAVARQAALRVVDQALTPNAETR